MTHLHGTHVDATSTPPTKSLSDLLVALAQHDPDAPSRVLEMYGDEIHRFIRFRMRDSVLRRLHDSIDVEQSVFRRFFQRASSNELRLANEDELRAYLFTLAKNRVRELKRSLSAAKRKANFVEEDSTFQLGQIGGNATTPDRAIAEAELMTEVRSLVGTDDWTAVVERLDGRTWKEVAEDQGVMPDTLRKRIQTALNQVKNRLMGNDTT